MACRLRILAEVIGHESDDQPVITLDIYGKVQGAVCCERRIRQ